jgi:rod shape determining protein RodA
MREDGKGFLKNIDGWLILIYLILVLMGWFNIYAAVYDENHSSIFDLSQRYGKQMTFIIVGLVLAVLVLLVDMRLFMNMAYFFYGLSMLTLVGVLIFGVTIAGTKGWYQFGGFSFQPAEFAKLAVCLAMAKYLSSAGASLKRNLPKFVAFAIIALPVGLVLLQPDMGSALVFSAFILVMHREGLPAWFLWTGFAAVGVFVLSLVLSFWGLMAILAIATGTLIYLNKRTTKNIIYAVLLFFVSAGFGYTSEHFFYKLEPHQKDRINVLLGKEVDLRGVGYNVNQSKIAIGSGGFLGKGFLNGTQTKFNFVPEQSTDFIFCTVGEEWGFVGSMVVLALFLILLLRVIFLAERQRNPFVRIYGYGVAAILFVHIFINIGMTIGLMPIIGIPLPFFSYGGSSLWAFTLLLFIFIKQDASRISF